jgi:single-strand DNA-binding protein
MNRIILIGRWCKDNDLRYSASGVAICKNTIAVDRRGKEKKTDFIPVTMLGKLGENIANHSGKGRLVAVEGTLQVDNYEKDGQKRTFTSVLAANVQFLDWPKDKQADIPGTEVDIPEEELPW